MGYTVTLPIARYIVLWRTSQSNFSFREMKLQTFRSALVTGASSGIGESIVEELCKAGLTTYALARRSAPLAALQERTGCIAMSLDLLDIESIYSRVSSLEVDVLVNSAGNGLGMHGLLHTSADDICTSMRVNVEAPLHLLRAILPGMLERKLGYILNVGSTAGLHPVGSALYGAAKGAMHRLSENLRIELAGTGIRVTEICPGRTDTELFSVALGGSAGQETLGALRAPLTPNDISRAVIYALAQPAHVAITTLEVIPTEEVIGGIAFASTPAQD